MPLDHESCWTAFAARDRRFEGRFVAAVLSTGIYCRPGCPARLPNRARVRFYVHPAAAQADGFRPCLRCRPDAAPGSPAWVGTSATVARGLRLIAGGLLDTAPVEALAERLGVGARHLSRLFQEHVGAAPGEVARTRRLHFARQLLERTQLPIAEVAFAAGFGSVRRFNEAVRDAFRSTPGELRRGGVAGRGGRGPSAAEGGRPVSAERDASLALRLAYRPPLDWADFRGFLGARALAGVERFDGDTWRRTFELDGAVGTVAVRPIPGEAALELTVEPPSAGVLLEVATRTRRAFDLDADPRAIEEVLARDPLLAPRVARHPGLRVPGAWDPFETAVRAILGQQISVAAATTLAGRLVRRHGRPLDPPRAGLTHLFPAAAALAHADPADFGVPRARAEALRALARGVADGAIRLAAAENVDATVAQLQRLPGFGPWTAQYVAMRACGEPDAFPAGDLGVRRALATGDAPASLAEAEARAERWRPWRAYAVMHLWSPPDNGVRGPPAGARRPA